jgi:cell division protein FtsQ
MRSGATVLWGSDQQSSLKAEVLVRLLAQPAHTYDVSVPGQPVTSPR